MDRNKGIKIKSSYGRKSYIIRFIVVSIVLSITSFLTPGFSVRGIWSVLLAGFVITTLDYAVEEFMKVDAAPFGKGLKGFAISAIILYVAQFVVPNMRVSMLGAIIASVVIGIIDIFMPGRIM